MISHACLWALEGRLESAITSPEGNLCNDSFSASLSSAHIAKSIGSVMPMLTVCGPQSHLPIPVCPSVMSWMLTQFHDSFVRAHVCFDVRYLDQALAVCQSWIWLDMLGNRVLQSFANFTLNTWLLCQVSISHNVIMSCTFEMVALHTHGWHSEHVPSCIFNMPHCLAITRFLCLKKSRLI